MSSACHIVLKTINHYGFQVKEVSDILDITLSTILRSITERAWSSNYEELHSKLRELFEEHFSICTFIKFEKLEHCAIEKLKVILLVLYLTLQNDFRICKNFMSNIPTADLDNKTANQLQVLFEKLSIWRRKHITEEHYLDNLMMENLGGNITEIETVPSSSKWIFSSPTVYSNSPKPNLKSYLQSPQFRREGTNQKLKNLQLKINSLEDANYNLKETNRLDLKDFEVSKLKLERVIEKLKQEVQYLQDHSEGLTHQVHLGEEEKRLQFVELKKNVSNLTTENEFLKSQIKLVEKDNADLVDKNKNLRNRLILTETELCNLNSDNEELRMTRLDNASIIEEITFELKESKKQLEELQNKLFCLQESDPKSSTLYEISFDGPPHSMEIDTSVLVEENMKKGFTDIKLAETEEKLTEVKKQLMLANEINDRHKLDLMELTTKVELEKKEREMAQYNCDQLQELIVEKENKLKDLLADMQLQAENLRDEKSILMSQFQKEILKFEISNKEKDSHLQKKEIESNEMKDLHQKEILILTENMNLEKQQFLNQIEQLNDQLSNTILERNSSLNKFELLTSEYEEAQQKYQDKVQLLEKKDEENNKMIMELESEAHQTKLNLRNYQLDKEHLISQLQKELENTCLKIAQMEIDFQGSFATIEKDKNGLNEEFGRLNLLNKQLEEKQEILLSLNANLNGEIVNLTEKNAKLQELIKSIEKENQSSIECHLMEKENLIIENDGLKLKNNDNIEEISSMVNKVENLNSQLKLKVESHENLLKLYEQKSLQYNELSQKQIKVESKLKSLNEDYEKKIEKSIDENKTLKAQNEITKTQNEDLLFLNISNKEIILANQKEIEILNSNLKLESDKYEEKIENLKLDAHQTISSLKSQLSLAEEKLTALNLGQQTLINLNENFVTEKHCLLAQIQDHEKQVTIWENKILKIKEECDLLSANISENKIVITELNNENILIKDKIKQSEEAFKTEETAYQIKAAELHTLCDERLKRTQELADQLSVSQFELSKKNQEFDLIEKTLNKKICTLQNIISEKENMIAELNNEKILCMEKVKQFEEMFKAEEAAHKRKAAELQSLCEERLKNAQALSDQLSVSQSELNTKSQEFNLMEESLNKKNCSLQNIISEKENMIAELNNKNVLFMEKVKQCEDMFKAEEAAHKIKASELQSLCEERLKNVHALSDQLSVSQSELNTKSQEFNLIEETLNKQICALQNVISEKENMIAELNNEKILCMEKVTQSEEMFKAEEAAHKIKASELQSLCEERLKNVHALSDQLSVSKSEFNKKSQEFNLMAESLNKKNCSLQNIVSEKENMITELNNKNVLFMEKVKQFEEMFKTEEAAHKIKAAELQSLCEERLKNSLTLSDQLSVSQSELSAKSQSLNLIEETIRKEICTLQKIISEKKNIIVELSNENVLFMEKHKLSVELQTEEPAYKINASEFQFLGDEGLKNMSLLSNQLSVSQSKLSYTICELSLMEETLKKEISSLKKNALKMSIELESSVNTISILNSDLNRLKEESQLTNNNNQQKFETLKCENKLLEENFKECMQLSNKNSEENILLQEKIAELGKDVEKYLMEKDVLLKKLECQTCSAVESKQVIESLRAELKSCMSRFENEKENLLNRANKSESEAVNVTDSLKIELIKMEEQAKKKEQEKEHFSSKLNNYELIIKSLEDNLKASEKKSKNNIDTLESKIMDKEAEYETKIKVLECKLINNETKYKNDIMTLESKIQKTNILTTQEKEKLKSKILDAKIESENQIKLLASKLKKKESEYETTLSNLYKDKHDFESKTVQMHAENKQMLLTISEQESCLDENKKVLNSLQEKVDNLTKDLDVKNNQICNIQEESEHKSEKINLLNNHVEELSGELTKLEKVLEIEKTSVLDLKEKVRKEEYEKQQISSALEQLKKSFDAKSDFESHEKQCMSNLEQHAQQTIKALQCQINTLIDKNEFEKQTLLEKLEIKNKLMDESASTIRQLSEKIKLADEKAASDREKLNTFKTAYRTEIGSIMKKVEEQSAEHKNFELLSKKYELLKRKMKETMEKNTELSSLSEAQEIQLKKQKETLDEISKFKNELETAELTLKKTHLEVKQKLIVSEGINKRLAAEKRSLETQLQFAETSLRDLQKHANRTNLPSVSGFAKPNTSSLTRSSTTRLSLKTQQPSQTNLTNNTAVKKQYSKPSIHLAPPPRTTRSYKSCTAVIPGKGNEVKVAVGPNSNDKLGHLERESLGRSVPKTMSSMFACEDEEEDHISFSNPKNLNNLVEGKMTLDVDYDWRRVSELQRRNTLCLPHLRSAYPAEMQFMPSEAFTDDQLREGQAMDEEQFVDLAEAADLLDINSPPASNLRKRKSSIDSQISISSSGGKRSRRTSTSYSRPGPPTPGRRGSGRGPYKENDNRLSIASRDSLVSLRSSMHTPLIDRQDPSSTRNSFGSPKTLALRSYKGLSPANKGARTPGSAMKQMFSRIKKSPWRKLHNDPDTDMKSLGDSTGSASNSKLKIFRKPFGGKNYNVLSASLRANDVENLNQTPGSGRILRHSIMENTPTTRKTNGKQ